MRSRSRRGAVARARDAGVTRVITIGTGIDSCRAALALADANDGVYAALGIDPHQAATAEAERVGELRELLAHPKAVAVGETGLDYHYGAETKDEQRRLFEAQLELAARARAPGRRPHARGERRHRGDPARARRHRRHALLLGARPAGGRPRARLVLLVRRQRHLPEGRGAARGRRGGPRRSDPGRDRQPVPCAAAACAAGRTSRRTSSTRSPRSPPPAARTPTSSRRRIDANATRRLRPAVTVVPEEAAGPALPRRREHPRRDRPARRARPGRRRARDRPRPRRPDPLPRRPRRAMSTPSSSTARSRRTSPTLADARRRPALGRRARARPRRARPGADEARREPPYNVATPIVAESLDRAARRSSSGA